MATDTVFEYHVQFVGETDEYYEIVDTCTTRTRGDLDMEEIIEFLRDDTTRHYKVRSTSIEEVTA